MKIVDQKIDLQELISLAKNKFGNMVKAVVDIKKGIMAIDAPLHADEEALLLSNGSRNEDLWGINLYPDQTGADFIEYDSMINLRPDQNNLTRGVSDPAIREKIVSIIGKLVIR